MLIAFKSNYYALHAGSHVHEHLSIYLHLHHNSRVNDAGGWNPSLWIAMTFVYPIMATDHLALQGSSPSTDTILSRLSLNIWTSGLEEWAGIAIQYIPRNMHTVFALLCFVVVIHWLIFPYPSGLLHWHCGNLTIAPVPAKQPWWIWINTSCEFIMNDCITTTKQSTTKPCAYFLGYTV